MKTRAIDLVKQLDGLSIEEAQMLLTEAKELLFSTQIVSADSPLLSANKSSECQGLQQR
jgi:hypothetical protein